MSENWCDKLAILGGPKAVNIMPAIYPTGTIEEEEIKAATDVLRKGPITATEIGTAVDIFEQDFASYVGAKYALATNSGTAALHSAVAAAGAGPGDEVIVPAYTYLASASCILHNGAKPVFADVDAQTFTLDPEDVKKRITQRTRAIMVVHIHGHPAPMDELCEIAREHDLVVIEDCAQANGAEYRGKKVGGIGDIGCMSFQASKQLACGEGGMLVTNNEELYERAAMVGNHIWKLRAILQREKYRRYTDVGGFGWNYRMHPMLAAIGSVRLRRLDEMNARRIANANYLSERLRKLNGIEPPYVANWAKHTYWIYTAKYDETVIKVPKQKFLEALVAEGVPIFAHVNLLGPIFEAPLYRQAIYSGPNTYGKGYPFEQILPPGQSTYPELPVTERLCRGTFCIYEGIHPPNGIALMRQYARAFEKVYENQKKLVI